MKKLFLVVGLLFFLGGGYYLKQNYTFVQLDSSQLAQVGSNTLQSSTLTLTDEDGQTYESRVFLRVGSFALMRRPEEVTPAE